MHAAKPLCFSKELPPGFAADGQAACRLPFQLMLSINPHRRTKEGQTRFSHYLPSLASFSHSTLFQIPYTIYTKQFTILTQSTILIFCSYNRFSSGLGFVYGFRFFLGFKEFTGVGNCLTAFSNSASTLRGCVSRNAWYLPYSSSALALAISAEILPA